MSTPTRITAGLLLVLWGASDALCASSAAVGRPTPSLRIESGRLAGAPIVDGVRSYKGIPYAAPPTGVLRWQPPQPAASWKGVRAAEHFGAQCMQRPIFGDMVFRASGMSEDCLFLNIWSQAAAGRGRLPVLVYFYGGGFAAGDGSEPRYDGANLAARGLVTVTVNYRLNIFGFFAHPELSAQSPRHSSGNYGLLDQSAALHWVRRNIAAFGGDPARITIAGESAGSFSVSAQMASPLSRNLIAGAIGESGSVLGGDRVQSLARAEAVGSQLGTLGGAPTLAALRAMPADQLLALSARPEAGWPAPVIDGHFFPKSPAEIYAANEQAHVPLLAGANNPEVAADFLLGELPPTLENYQRKVREQYGMSADEVLKWYPVNNDAEARQTARELASDRFIVQGTWKWVDEAARVNPDHTYYYRYDKPRPASRAGDIPAGDGAVHAGEIEYALGNLDGNTVYAWTTEDRQMSQTMQGYFVNFIKTGNPNGGGLPYWPPYTTGKLMILDVSSRAEFDATRSRHQAMDRLMLAAH